MKHLKEPKPVTLEQVKDEYAREKRYNDWSHFFEHCFEVAIQNYKPGLIEDAFSEIATRYASVMAAETSTKQ